MSDPRANLAWAAKQAGKSLAELSRAAGKNHAYLQQFVTRGVPSKLPESVRAYLSAALHVSEAELGKPDLVLHGADGTMMALEAKRYEPRRLSEDDEYREEQAELHRRSAGSSRAYNPDNYKPRIPGMIPELDGQLGAGEGTDGQMLTLPLGGEAYSGHAIVDEWLFPETWLRQEINASVSKTIVMPIIGDSMEPSYRPGDRVLVDRTQNRLLSDSVYVISDGESAPKIKRLVEVMFSKPRMVNIVSDNPAIADQSVPAADLTILGRVVGVVSRR